MSSVSGLSSSFTHSLSLLISKKDVELSVDAVSLDIEGSLHSSLQLSEQAMHDDLGLLASSSGEGVGLRFLGGGTYCFQGLIRLELQYAIPRSLALVLNLAGNSFGMLTGMGNISN